jgi:hypothetical protein
LLTWPIGSRSFQRTRNPSRAASSGVEASTTRPGVNGTSSPGKIDVIESGMRTGAPTALMSTQSVSTIARSPSGPATRVRRRAQTRLQPMTRVVQDAVSPCSNGRSMSICAARTSHVSPCSRYQSRPNPTSSECTHAVSCAYRSSADGRSVPSGPHSSNRTRYGTVAVS